MNAKFFAIAALCFVGCGSLGEAEDATDGYEGFPASGASGTTTSALTHPLRVFVTSTMHAPGFGDIYGADQLCAQHATAANLGGRWKAWVSDSKISAPKRMRGEGPWTLVDGTTVLFPNRAAKFIAPAHAIDHDEFGTKNATHGLVWTGTSRLGEPSVACIDWSVAKQQAMGEVGVIGGSETTWSAATSVPCEGGAYLYCFEQP